MKPIVVDIHAHFTPKLVFERFDTRYADFPGVRLMRESHGTRMQFPGTEPTRPIMPRLSDLDDRRAWMDRNGIDHQLVGGWLDSFGYELAPREGLAWSRFLRSEERRVGKASGVGGSEAHEVIRGSAARGRRE